MKAKLFQPSHLILLAAALLFSACTPEVNEIPVGLESNGTQVTLAEGELLVISLESNPTTGFGWHVAEIDGSVLKQVGEAEFTARSSDEALVGGPGMEVLRFETVGPGTCSLTLTYDRSWEDVAPEQVFSLTIVVP